MKPINIQALIHPILEEQRMSSKARTTLEDNLMRALREAEEIQYAYYQAYVKFLQERVTEAERQTFNARYKLHYDKGGTF